MDRIVFKHNSAAVAEAIAKRGTDAIAGIDRGMGRGAHELARDAQQTMPKFRSRTATATGVEHPGPLHWRVVFGTRWAVFTEGGSGPGGRPSLAELRDWIRLKNITPRTPGVSASSLAFLIQRSIARKGVPAQQFASKSLERARPRLAELVEAAAAGAMAGTPR